MTLEPNKFTHRLMARMRLFYCFCPRCNSDAPAVDTCACCNMVHSADGFLAPNQRQIINRRATRALWWYTWVHPSFQNKQTYWENLSITERVRHSHPKAFQPPTKPQP